MRGGCGAETETYPDPRSKSSVVVPGSPPLGDPILVEKVVSDWARQGACKGPTIIDRMGAS